MLFDSFLFHFLLGSGLVASGWRRGFGGLGKHGRSHHEQGGG
jgi:hypothetical protein